VYEKGLPKPEPAVTTRSSFRGSLIVHVTEEIAMSNSKMWLARLPLAVFTATTVLLAGCGAGGGGQEVTAGPVNAPPSTSTSAAPPQGVEQSFAVLGGSTVTNTGPTVITGNLGLSPGTAVTGFPPGIVTGGTTHAADAVALQAQNDTTTAYLNPAGQTCTSDLTGQDLGGKTLVPGTYCYSSSAQLTGTLTLDAGGDASAVWVFKTGSTLTTASNSSVRIINGGQPCNVYWQVGSSATLGTTTSFIGNILALTSITLTTGATVSGRVLARNGAVTLDSNTIAVSVCGAPPVPPVTPIPPTLGKSFSPATISAGGVSTLTITLSNANSTAASLTAAFIDTLPSGLMVVAGSTRSTCIEPFTAGSSSFSPAWFILDGSAVGLTGGSIPANGSCTVTAEVTATVGGSYINLLPAGALQTSNGNNAAPAVATLTVNATAAGTAPTLGKSFSPATISAGGITTLTLILSNPNGTVARLTAPLIDVMPTGLVVIGGSTSSTCIDPFAAGISSFSPAWFVDDTSAMGLTGGSIPANGSCQVTARVTAPVAGTYFNSVAAGALQTSNGNNAAPAVSTLTVQ